MGETTGPRIQETTEDRERQLLRGRAIDALVEFRKSMPKMTAAELASSRRQGRP